MRVDEVVAAGDLEVARHQPDRGRDAERRAHSPGDDAVRRAFGQERLNQAATLGTDGASHAHLWLTFGRQHHEDHEDQHDAGGDGEQAEDQEECREQVAVLLRGLHGVGLGLVETDRAFDAQQRATLVALQERLEAADRGVRPRVAGRDAAFERDAEEVELPLVAGQRLDAGQQHRAAAGRLHVESSDAARSQLVLDDADDPNLGRSAGDVDREHVAGLRVELLGGTFAQVDVRLTELRQVGLTAADQSQAAELAEALRVNARERYRGLGLLATLVDSADRLLQQRDEARDVGVVGEALLEGRRDAVVEVDRRVAVHRVLADKVEREVGALKLVVADAADRVVDRVAGGEGSRRNQGREHEADDDEAGLQAATRNVAQAHAEHVAAGYINDAHTGDSDGEQRHQHQHDRVHRDAE